MSVKTVKIGDISDAWAVCHLDKDGNRLPLDAHYKCTMALVDCNGDVMVTRDVPDIEGDAFLLYLTTDETSQLKHRHRYTIVAELENAIIEPKPLKKETEVEFEAVAGVIN